MIIALFINEITTNHDMKYTLPVQYTLINFIKVTGSQEFFICVKPLTHVAM